MSKKDFDEFIAAQAEHAGVVVDWEKEKSIWIDQVNRLYAQVREFVADYVSEDKMSIREGCIQLSESGLGQYDIPTLTLRVGIHEVKLNPVGMNIIAARGAVDVEGVVNRVRLVLVDKETDVPKIVSVIRSPGEASPISQTCDESGDDLEWKVVERLPYIRYAKLDKDKFLDIFMAVANV